MSVSQSQQSSVIARMEGLEARFENLEQLLRDALKLPDPTVHDGYNLSDDEM
jgi:hypothetical protein